MIFNEKLIIFILHDYKIACKIEDRVINKINLKIEVFGNTHGLGCSDKMVIKVMLSDCVT